MNFKDFDKHMRTYETSLDQYIPEGTYIVVRLDGRGFTKLTKETCNFEKPFDKRFRNMMVRTTKHLMECGFQALYGYTQSDEISILLSPDDKTFEHKVRKIITVLAGEASGFFSVQLGRNTCFDARIIPLPDKKTVADYFLWRQQDCSRNCLNGWCYWTLRCLKEEPKTARKATSIIKSKTYEEKIQMLKSAGIDYTETPSWQKNGIGIYKQKITRTGYNPITKQETKTIRSEFVENQELPTGEYYKKLIEKIL